MIDLTKAAELAKTRVIKRTKHKDYQRTVDLARKYKALKSGEDLGYLMRRFNRRESEQEFDQRMRLTKHITPAIIETLTNPARKLQGVKPIVDKIDYGKANDSKAQDLQIKIKQFAGGTGVDSYLGSLTDPSDADPNAFVVLTFDNFDERYEHPSTYPVLIGAADIWDFQYHTNDLQYLWIHRTLKYLLKDKTEKEGDKFVMYVDDHHIVFTQVEDAVAGSAVEQYLDADGSIIEVTDTSVKFGVKDAYYFRPNKDTLYMVAFYDQKSGQVPAFRIGCKADTYTDGRTCVNRWHAALPYLEKSLKQVSELDLTTSLHVFPQKLQYVGKCSGKDCNKGYVGPNMDQECGVCKGTGMQTITSAQDHIQLPLPKHKDDMWDLSMMTHYVQLPVELIQQMRDIVKDTRADSITAVFSSDVFTRANVQQTATGQMIDMQSVYDAEQPHAMWWSEVRVIIAKVIAAYNDMLNADLNVVFRFPRNFKFESIADIVDTMTNAKGADAGPSVMSMLNMNLIEQLYVDDPDTLKKAQTMERFNPYPGMSDDTVTALISGGKATAFNAMLWIERATVFAEAERSQMGKDVYFYDLDESKQWTIIKAIVDAMVAGQAVDAPEFSLTLGVVPDPEESGDLGNETEQAQVNE